MDSWTLKGDSYSFLRSAPRTISLRHREGTPNHVEIFDITNIPSPRTAISETTCLCDIFGDDRESPSLSSSPASAAFVPPPREVDRGSAASPLVDDSSGSYHTAHGSSEGEEGFEDPKETPRSPTLPTGISEGEHSQGHNQTSEHLGLSAVIPKLESAASPTLPLLSTECASLEVLNAASTSRTPSPRKNSPQTLMSAEDRGISSSPSSPLSSHRASSQSRSPQPSNLGASLSSVESQLTPPLLESSGSPKTSLSSSGSRKGSFSSSGSRKGSLSSSGSRKGSLSSSGSHNSNLSSEQRPQSPDDLQGLTAPTFEPRVIFSSNSTSRSSVDIYRQSEERLIAPELRDYSYSPDIQDCSPFSELRGRVSVHDLFNRDSSPDIEASPYTPELGSCTLLAGGDTPENLGSRLSAEAKSAVSTPLSRYTPPSPVSPIAHTPDLRGNSTSPVVRYTPSPALSLGVPHTSPTSDSLSQALSPVPYSLPSHEVSSDYCPKESDYTAASPEIRVTASSPEVRRRETSLEENLALNSEDHQSECSRATTSSPHITGLCYSVIQPEEGDTATYPEIAHLSTSEPIWRKPLSPEPKSKALVKQIEPKTSQEESTVPIVSPDQYYKYSDLEPDNTETTESPQPRCISLTPERRHYTPSPELRHQRPSPETRPYSPSPTPRDLVPSPDTILPYPLPETRTLFPLPEKREETPSPESTYLAPSPGKRRYTPSPEPIHFETHHSPSPELRDFNPSPRIQHYSYSSEPSNILQSPEKRQLTPSPEQRNLPPSLEKRQLTPSPEPRNLPPSPEKRQLTPSPEKRQLTPSPETRNLPPSPEKRQLTPSPEPRNLPPPPDKRQLTPSPEPRNLPPSPEKRQLTPSPEPRNLPPSPEKRQLTPSPEPRNPPPSPEKGQLSPSPEPRNLSPSPEKRQLTPSPEPRNLPPSPEKRQLTPSPEPRNLPPSPENGQLTPSPEPGNLPPSPEERQLTPSLKTRYPTSSPEKNLFTPSSQPTDTTPSSGKIHFTPSPEPIHFAPSPLNRQYSPVCEPKHIILSPEEKRHTPSPGRISYTSSPVSSHLVPSPEQTYCNLSPEQGHPTLTPVSTHHITSPDPTCQIVSPEPRLNESLPNQNLSPDPRNHTPSPRQLVSSRKPSLPSPLPVADNLTPSPQPRHISHSPGSKHHSPQVTESKYLSQSPESRRGKPSPLAPSVEPRCNPHITGSFLRKVNSQSAPQPPLFPQDTPKVEESTPSDLPNPHSRTAVAVAKQQSAPPESSSVVKPPGDRKFSRTPEQHSEPRRITPKEKYLQSVQSNSFTQKEVQNRNPSIDIQSPFHGPPVCTGDGQPDILFARRGVSVSPVHRGKEPKSKFPFNSARSDKRENKNSKTSCKPEYTRKQPSTKVVILSREESAEDMAHHASKRRTPSPPITRFTPVHIIAPEKPYRLWQNRGRSPPQVAASTLPDNLKNQMPKWGSPDVTHRNSSNQDDWLGQESQMEMARDIPLEAVSKGERDTGREQPKYMRGMESERKREERPQEKREGRQGHASYRGQQVELSFSARNRKGPESHSTASTGKQTSKGMLTAHSYSERLLATRQPQQQQRRGGPTRRLQPSVPQNMSVAPGRVSKNRPRQSSSSSMGSELDEADSEVKWFSDVAFRSLSSPELDYLDMYNSSHRSSTNISQPSTQESPAGASASLLAYADFKGSGQRLDNEDFPFQPTTYYSDGLDPAKRYEMGSFECVDVAVEREEPRKGRRGVPKRQIQLKRKNTLEARQDESSENGSPVVPVMADSPSFQGSLKETLLRQHSTPETMHESYHCEPSTDIPEYNKKTSKLQKSTSLDETHPKTKMATCLIKSVLSKKMQSVDREEPKGEGTFSSPEEKPPSPVQAKETLKKPTKNAKLNPSLSSEDLAVGTESNTMASNVRQHFEIKSGKRPSPTVSQHSYTVLPDNEETNFNTTAERSGMRSELMVPFRRQGGCWEPEEEKAAGKSASMTVGNKGVHFATGSDSHMEARQGQECRIPGTEERKQHEHSDKSKYMSKTPEIIVKDGLANDKKKSSLNVSLTPEPENKPELRSEVPSPGPSPGPSPKRSFKENEDKEESKIDTKTEEEDGNNKVKVPMHKVRDVRRLVKNTYNLSFKANSAAIPSPKMEEHDEIHQDRRTEEITEERKVESKNVKFEAGQEDRKKETTQASQKVTVDKQRGELREDRIEEPKKEGRDAEHPTSTTTPLEQKGRSRFHSQPMQIECKAVCWKEDKDKMTPSRTEEGKHGDQREASAQLSVTESAKPEGYLYGCPESHMTDQTTTSKPCESDANKEPKEHSMEIKNYTTPVEAKPEMARRYKKPPLLGSLPKLPSKEREVSTAVVVIRDGFNKQKTAQDERPMPATANTESSGHAVSMLLKEKGYQAEIGAVLNEGEHNTVGGKGVPHKHVNRLEIPLQICSTSESGVSESQRERTFSTSSKSTPMTETPPSRGEEESVGIKPPMRDCAQQNTGSPLRNTGGQTITPPMKQIEQKDFDALKRQDPTFPPRPNVLRFKPQQIEVKSLSKETQKQETSTNNLMLNKKPQSIEVKSIANNQTKPAVPPKPNYKFKPPDLGLLPNESETSADKTLNAKPQEREERPQTIVVSSPTIYRKLSSESTSASNYTRKLAVSAVSSCRPPQNKTTVSSQSNSSASSDKEQSINRAQHPEAFPQSSSCTQSSVALAPALAPATHPVITSEPGVIPGTNVSQISGSSSTVANVSGQSAVVDLNSQPQYSRTTLVHNQARTVTSNNEKQTSAVSTTRAPQYAHEQRPFHRSLSSERPQRADDLRFYASDDPPSYDERESFSPLMLQGLTPKKPNRYPRPPPCSCTSGCPSHPGLTPPHHHHSPHNHTPPASAHSPGHSYPIAQPPPRPHQCRAEPPPMCYQPSSPKSSPLGPGHPPPAMYHPLNQPPSYPPHPSLLQSCAPERTMQPHQHMEPRRPLLHRPPQQQQQQPVMSGAPYSDHGHGHSPGLPHLDSQYLCGPQGMGPSYGSEYEGDGSSIYSEGGFGQTPRRMLMDPETGKYFYIEVPVQPLRKMLFDPETGQYVEVLIPQQSMSHSGLYPPTAAPYPAIHNPNMYAPAPQYMQPYAAPPPQPPPPHPQTQPPPPARHPDNSAAAALHQNGAGVVYGGPSGQGSKMDSQTHAPLDQSYLEGMYYVPTGMNASPNPPPPDCYHKHSPSHHSGVGGKRS